MTEEEKEEGEVGGGRDDEGREERGRRAEGERESQSEMGEGRRGSREVLSAQHPKLTCSMYCH